MRALPPSLVALPAFAVAFACSSPGGSSAPALSDVASPPPVTAPATADAPPPDARALDAAGLYLQPNVQLPDGSLGFLHVTEADMPLRVAIGHPPVPPKYASREETRAAAIEAMQMWERAIRPQVPWFRLEFVEEDPDAAVQVQWKRRITGPWAGFGEIRHRQQAGLLRVGGRMQVSTTPSQFETLTIDEVRLLIAHEFGHVLGLGHCFECDSAMNYSWDTRGRILVTETDVRTFQALVAQPNLAPASEVATNADDARDQTGR